VSRWRSSATGTALDLRSVGRGVKILLEAMLCNNLPQVVYIYHLCASVTKQYNLVPAKGRWCSLDGEVTASLAESNGSLPPGGWRTVTCRLTACTPGSAPGPTLSIEYGKAFTLAVISLQGLQPEPVRSEAHMGTGIHSLKLIIISDVSASVPLFSHI